MDPIGKKCVDLFGDERLYQVSSPKTQFDIYH